MPGRSLGSREGRSPPPAWLDAAFVEVALRRAGRRNVRVVRVETSYATAIGDHYCSRMFRVEAAVRDQDEDEDEDQEQDEGEDEVHEDQESVSLLVKCSPEDNMMLSVLRERGEFDTEVSMYKKVLPALNELLRKYGLEEPPLTARFFAASTDAIITLEDLAAQGFVMKDRFAGLDYEHAAAVLRALGRFHAATHVLLAKDPQLLERYQSIFQKTNKNFGGINSTLIRTVASVVRSWEDEPPGLADRIEAVAEISNEKRKDLTSKSQGAFKVLNHGDLWTNNIMFRRKNGEVECRFVDLQLCFVGSPAIDLITFQMSSLEEAGWRERWPRLVAEYSASLAAAARQLGAGRVPSADDVLSELRGARAWALLAGSSWLPVILTDAGKKFDFAGCRQGGARALAALSDSYKRRLRLVLPYCDEVGVFDDFPK